MRRTLAAAVTVAAVLTPLTARSAGQIITNPFGNLQMRVLRQPTGGNAGLARLTIVTANGQAFSGGSTIYFGLRLMGSEDAEMLSFKLPRNRGKCIVSDFAGNRTKGWQGAAAFGAAAPGLGSLNSHMRMIGGFVRKSCGNIEIDVGYRNRPFVLFYAAFFSYKAAPWHGNYAQQPWGTVPAGGNATYYQWWDLWGAFDTLGYSNACTNASGTAVSCG